MSDDEKNIISGYTLLSELTNEHSGFAKWGYAEKDGRAYFIKEFLSPVYPDKSSPLSNEQKKRKINECDEWVERKKAVYSALNNTSNGNIIIPLDFFRSDSHYYSVTDKVDVSSLTTQQISSLDNLNKLIILKVFANCLKKIGEASIVHGDLKPDNLLIKETVSGMYTVKLIDFDSSYLETALPPPDELQCDPTYMSPEAFLYMIGETDKLDKQSDIFSAGLIFHQYFCGELPTISDEYDYIYEAVLDDAEVVLNDSIPPRITQIISMMLKKNPSERLNSEYLWQLILLTTQSNLSKGTVDSADAHAESKTYFYPASDDEW
jgi:eukaryotic-like serine/threonine-protein kinase